MQEKRFFRVLTLFLLFILCQNAAAQNNAAFPRIRPDSKVLEYFILISDNACSWRDLSEISLWASGNSTPANIDRFESAVVSLNNSAGLPLSGRERAEYIFDFMHRNYLRAYSLYQTRVDTIFTNGSYNCVSSSVLYMILCESAGINTSAVITKDHAFIMVHIDGQDIDVETTNRYGFDPGNRREFHDQAGRLTGFTYVPAQNYTDRQTIGKIELISLILNNRIADLERRNGFTDAVPLAVDRAALLFGDSLAETGGSADSLFPDPRSDLFDRLLNYGGSLLRAGREEDSLRWAVTASLIYPSPDRWVSLIQMSVNNRTAKLLRDNRAADAKIFLENNRAYLTAETFAELDSVVTDADILYRANRITSAASGDAVISDIEMARNNGTLRRERVFELLAFAVQKTTSAISAAPSRDWRAAVNYIEDVIARFGESRELEQALLVYRGNLANDYHSRFAAEWNRRNYEEAERILNEGLAEFPDNRQLLSNRAIVDRQNSR